MKTKTISEETLRDIERVCCYDSNLPNDYRYGGLDYDTIKSAKKVLQEIKPTDKKIKIPIIKIDILVKKEKRKQHNPCKHKHTTRLNFGDECIDCHEVFPEGYW